DHEQAAPADAVAERAHGDQHPGDHEAVDVDDPQELCRTRLQVARYRGDRKVEHREVHRVDHAGQGDDGEAQPIASRRAGVRYSSPSMGSSVMSSISAWLPAVAPGSSASRDSPALVRSIHSRRPSSVKRTSYAASRTSASNCSDNRRASVGLSMTRPISVFRRAERGSKLKEPTKMRASSIANVLACRLADELCPYKRFVVGAVLAAVGLSSNRRTPPRRRSTRRFE